MLGLKNPSRGIRVPSFPIPLQMWSASVPSGVRRARRAGRTKPLEEVTTTRCSEQPARSIARRTRSGTRASFAIAAGVSVFELARFMGTSVSQIDATYGHLLPDARDRAKLALDAFIAADAGDRFGTQTT